MTNYTITPINTGLVNSNKATYLYHHSVHKFYDVEGNVQLPVTVFLAQGGGRKVMIDTGMSNTEIAGKYHHPGSIQPEGYAVHEQLKKLGVDPSEITPPGRFLNIEEAWDSIRDLKRRAKSHEFILPTHAPEMLDAVASGRVYGK